MLGGMFVAFESVEVPDRVREVKVTSLVCLATVQNGACGPANSVALFAAGENRIIVSLSEMSPNLVNAVIATEDRGYFRHSGVDPMGIARAVYRDLRGDTVRQGGSTITQQYVKNVYLSSEQSLFRKIREAAIAMKLERELSKDEILERYLNEIYFGRGANGVEAAAQVYFNKDSADLNVAEGAFLAGLIRRPSDADPDNYPEEALRRRTTSVNAMLEEGYVTQAQADEANSINIAGWAQPRATGARGTQVEPSFRIVGGEYITEWVRQQLIKMPNVGEKAVYSGGLRVYLTIDPTLQNAAAASIAEVMGQPGDPSTALVSLSNDGRIVAMVAGQDYQASEVNLALGGGGGRQAGSTFKPVALATWVEAGNSLQSQFAAPDRVVFPKANNGEDWEVKNYGYDEENPPPVDAPVPIITAEQATWNSVNTAYAQLMQQADPKKVAEMAKRLGIVSEVAAVPATVLGTPSVSPLEMARAYSVFMNKGTVTPTYIIRRVEDADGTAIFDVGDKSTMPELQPSPAIPQPVAETVTSALTGVIKNGSGKAAAIRQPVAGKTGTTNNNLDAWFVGYSCTVATTVWQGFLGKPGEDTPPMSDVRGGPVTGSRFPAQIFGKYMAVATEGQKGCSFPKVDAGLTVGVPDPQFLPTTTLPPPAPVDPAAPAPGAPPPLATPVVPGAPALPPATPAAAPG